MECGNGIINSNERCDDNNILSGDGCSSHCSYEKDGFNCLTINYSVPT